MIWNARDLENRLQRKHLKINPHGLAGRVHENPLGSLLDMKILGSQFQRLLLSSGDGGIYGRNLYVHIPKMVLRVHFEKHWSRGRTGM